MCWAANARSPPNTMTPRTARRSATRVTEIHVLRPVLFSPLAVHVGSPRIITVPPLLLQRSCVVTPKQRVEDASRDAFFRGVRVSVAGRVLQELEEPDRERHPVPSAASCQRALAHLKAGVAAVLPGRIHIMHGQMPHVREWLDEAKPHVERHPDVAEGHRQGAHVAQSAGAEPVVVEVVRCVCGLRPFPERLDAFVDVGEFGCVSLVVDPWGHGICDADMFGGGEHGAQWSDDS